MRSIAISTLLTIGLVFALIIPLSFIVNYFALSEPLIVAIFFVAGVIYRDLHNWILK